MEGTKFVKAVCNKTGQFFGLEVKQFGSQWEVVNVTPLSNEEARVASSEVKQNVFKTNSALLPCLKCGSRIVGGCSCSRKKHQCSSGMKYHFDCVYCENFKIDYSLPSSADVGRRAGETVVLSQGQEVKIRYADNRPMKKIIVGIGWDPAIGFHDMDVDSSVVVLSQFGVARELVYYGDKEHRSGCVIHHGDNLTGETLGQNGDDENITVNLDKVPSNRDKLVFVLNIYNCDDRHQTLDKVRNLYIKLYDPDSKKTLIEYRVSGNAPRNHTAMIIGVAFRRDNSWSFKAVGKSLYVSDVQ